MGSDLIDGLRISVIGMSLTFLALLLLILVMVLLMRIFPERNAAGDKISGVDRTTAEEDADLQRQEEIAVAIAVSVCLLDGDDAPEYRDPYLGKLLEQ